MRSDSSRRVATEFVFDLGRARDRSPSVQVAGWLRRIELDSVASKERTGLRTCPARLNPGAGRTDAAVS
jgi:hypothetical protein